MQLSQAGLNLIKSFEGWVDHVYDDGAGNPTIGYGHLVKSGEQFPSRISQAEGESLLAQDVAYYVDLVNSLVRVPVTQQMFDALVSLAYNWRDFPSSQALQYLNAGNYQAAAQRISEHPVTAGGKVLPGLVTRRKREAAYFLSGGIPDGGNFRKLPPTATAKTGAKQQPKRR